MGMRASVSFQEYFATLTDPRCPQAPNSRHLLMDILILGPAQGTQDTCGKKFPLTLLYDLTGL